MADNFLEKQHDDYLARQARKERERKRRLHRYLEAYRKRLAAEKAKEESGDSDLAEHQ